MKITGIKVIHTDAGWRTWSFIRVLTDSAHLTGWSEVSDSHGSPSGIEGVVKDLSPLLIGEDPREIERLYHVMLSRTRQSQGGIINKAIAGIENALLDIKAKALGVPVCDLWGGPVRNWVKGYWSHAGTSRVRAARDVNRLPITGLDDMKEFIDDVRASGFDTIKTNIPLFLEDPHVYMPGFCKPSTKVDPNLEPSNEVMRGVYDWIHALREHLPGHKIILDLNYNFKPESIVRIANAMYPMGIEWLEIDHPCPKVLRDIREQIGIPICSGENLYGVSQYKPFLDAGAMDVVSIDVLWNGFLQSVKIAQLADAYGLNVTVHNFNSHLATAIHTQFAAVTPNFKIMEYDVDDVRWRDDIVTQTPLIYEGRFSVASGAGWGCDLNEGVASGYPRKL